MSQTLALPSALTQTAPPASKRGRWWGVPIATWASALVYMCSLAIVATCHQLALLPGRAIAHFAWMSLLCYALTVASAKWGPTRWRDSPQLTVAQMLISIGPALIVSVDLQSMGARGGFAMMYVVTKVFGLIKLNRGQFVLIAAVFWLSYAGLLGYLHQNRGGHLDPVGDLVFLAALGLSLTSVAFLGSHVFAMRSKLRERSAALAATLEKIQQQVAVDELTGAASRHQMTRLLAQEAEHSARGGPPLCVGLIDVDHFKHVNDQFGHAVGDAMLQLMVAHIQSQLRSTDRLARWGGEEFLLLMPATTLGGASAKMEALRTSLASLDVSAQAGTWRLTFSGGVAQHKPGAEASETVSRADAALYRAKMQGRNQVREGA